MKKKLEITLPGHLIKKLQELPETGMGYQVVNFELRDGTILKSVTVLNASIVLLDKDMDVLEIVKVELSKSD